MISVLTRTDYQRCMKSACVDVCSGFILLSQSWIEESHQLLDEFVRCLFGNAVAGVDAVSGDVAGPAMPGQQRYSS